MKTMNKYQKVREETSIRRWRDHRVLHNKEVTFLDLQITPKNERNQKLRSFD